MDMLTEIMKRMPNFQNGGEKEEKEISGREEEEISGSDGEISGSDGEISGSEEEDDEEDEEEEEDEDEEGITLEMRVKQLQKISNYFSDEE